MRVISRLDIKGDKLIKGVKFEGLRQIGCPIQKAKEYYNDGIDEIICIDAVASLYGRNNAVKLVKEISKNIFLPITVCGGIRTIEDASNIILSGADKIGINTAAVENPKFLTILAKEFGSQSIVLSVEAKKKSPSTWEVFVNSGRDPTGIDVKLWIKKAVDLGIGSVFLTSIDNDGTKLGFDKELCEEVFNICEVPLVISGGLGKIKDLTILTENSGMNGFAAASAFHNNLLTINETKKFLIDYKINVKN